MILLPRFSHSPHRAASAKAHFRAESLPYRRSVTFVTFRTVFWAFLNRQLPTISVPAIGGIMFRHIFLAIFVACLALPATATPACHDTPLISAVTLDHSAMDHSTHKQTKPTKQTTQTIHGCIGCSLPPATQFQVFKVATINNERPMAVFHKMMLATKTGPDTPPPRTT